MITLPLTLVVFQQMMQEVPADASLAKPLKVGAEAPDSTLRGLDGKEVKLRSLIENKSSVIVFYRGGWCPFCNRHLADLGKVEPELKELGYQILAITPDSPEELKKTMDKHQLTYSLLSDGKAAAMKNFGVAYKVDGKTLGMLKSYEIDLGKASGGDNSDNILPVPSLFIVDAKGKVVYVHSNPDYKVRLKGDEVLEAAKKAKG